jgi:hypothetical protein
MGGPHTGVGKAKNANSLQELWLEIWDGRLGVAVEITLI